MSNLTVTPDEFILTLFEHHEVVAVAQHVVDVVGLADRPVVIAVNETTPLRRVLLTSLDPITLDTEGGALEDPKRPRRLSPEIAGVSLSRVLLRARDRVDGSFADAPPDLEISQAGMSAWNTFATGRAGRAGFAVQQQRQRYEFRNRHQFSDAADAVFDRLWAADTLTWQQVSELSASVA